MLKDKSLNRQVNYSHVISYFLLILSTVGIFFIAEVIRAYLIEYELNSMFISFCVGFILFTPLVSLLLHPLLFSKVLPQNRSPLSIMLKNIGLVMVVQCLFFLIWITDAIAVYSIYVDHDSFLAKAFNITSQNRTDLTNHFYWGNIILACFFALLSLIIGVLPCLVAQLNNQGVVKNFAIAISFTKKNKISFLFYACVIALTTVLPLLYAPYLFLVCFPLAFTWVCTNIFQHYQVSIS